MTVTTNEYGQNNLLLVNTNMVEEYNRKGLESPTVCETYNGRWAMMNRFWFHLYAITGKFFFGIF